MKVTVLFFGATAETVGQRSAEIRIADGLVSDEAFDEVFTEFPALEVKHGRKHLHLSVNREYAKGNEVIRENDELAVFTAVSGG